MSPNEVQKSDIPAIFDELKELYLEKGGAYGDIYGEIRDMCGDGNDIQALRYAVITKLLRYNHQFGTVTKNERVEDTIKDLAVYTIMLLGACRRQWLTNKAD